MPGDEHKHLEQVSVLRRYHKGTLMERNLVR